MKNLMGFILFCMVLVLTQVVVVGHHKMTQEAIKAKIDMVYGVQS